MGQKLSRGESLLLVVLAVGVSAVSLLFAGAMSIAGPSPAPGQSLEATPAASKTPLPPTAQPTLTAGTTQQNIEAARSWPTTAISAPTRQPLPSPTASPAPVPEGMVLVPAGYFLMGRPDGNADEQPEHPVLLEAFYLDRHEVSNAEYQQCVEAGACRESQLSNSFTRASYRDSPEFAGYPVIGVSWEQARDYCQWLGQRLPTEAEWEYAASGPDNRLYPWGNAFERERLASDATDTQPVDAYPSGASALGVFNLAGNVAEWVEDAYDPTFYDRSPPTKPLAQAQDDQPERVYRGGSFGNPDVDAYTTSRRYHRLQTYYDVDIGFRCGLSATDRSVAALSQHRLLEAQFCAVYHQYRPGAVCP